MNPADKLSAPTPAAIPPAESNVRQQAEGTQHLSDLALKAISQGVIITGPDTKIISANPAFLAITGYAEAEVLGRSCHFLQGPGSDPQTVTAIRQALKKQQEFSGEILNYRKDGTPYWNDLSISPVHDTRGVLTHFIGITRDITARKAAESAHRASEKRFGDTFSLMPAALTLQTEQGVILECSENFCQITGYAREQAIGRDALELNLWADPTQRVAQREALQRDGRVDGLEFLVRHRDGHTTMMHLSARYLMIGSERLLLSLAHDITERKAAEEKLRASEQRYATTLAAVNDGLWDWDLSSGNAYCSPLYFTMLGYADGAYSPNYANWRTLVHPEDLERVERDVQNSLGTGRGFVIDMRMKTAAGAWCWVSSRGNTVERDSDGKVLRMVGTLTDITARKQAEALLHESDQRFNDLVNSTDGIVWEADAITFSFNSVSKNAERLLGYPAADWLTPGFWASHLHPEDRDRAVHYCVACTGRMEDHDFEYRFVAADGRSVWLRDIVRVVSENQKPRWLRGLMIDITKQKETAAALQASEQKLRTIYETMAEGVALNELIFDGHGTAVDYQILDVNPAFYSTADYSGRQVIGAVATALYGLSSESIRDFWLAHRHHNEVQHIEMLSPLNQRWFLISTSPILHDRFVTVFFDITDRKRAEAAQQASEADLLEAQRVAQIGNWSWDIATNVVHWSAEMNRIYGREQKSVPLSYEEQLKFYAPESAARLHAAVQKAVASGTAYELDLERDSAGGPKRWISARGEALRDTSGRIVQLRGTAQDITARKEAEAALARTTSLLEVTGALAKIGGWEVNLENMKLSWTLETFRIAELEPPLEPALEQGIALFAPEARPTIAAAVQATIDTGKPYDLELPLITAKGNHRWVQTQGYAEMRNGKAIRIYGTFQDITARKQADDALHAVEDQLRQSQKLESLGTLAGGIAHDFNNILAGISGFNALARQAVGNSPEALDYLGEIDRASKRAAKLVQQVLAFSRADDHTLVPTQIGPVVAEAAQLLRATLPSSIEFHTSLATDLTCVLGNSTQLHQVVMNLGTNAGYAMRENGGHLHLRLEASTMEDPVAAGLPELPPGPCVRLIVRDTGCGMDAATMKRVFDPFFTTKGPGEGTGLGLSVLHGIVRTHHGAIRLTSEPGHGTTFTIHLPAIVDVPRQVEVDPEAIPLGHGQRILFVDDEAILTRLGALLLRQLGYVAESESSVRQALELVERDPHAFDLVLTDQTMPGMSGLEFATRLHQLRPDLPVIIASGFSAKLTPQQIQAANVKEVLAKPYTKENLATALHRQLKNAIRK